MDSLQQECNNTLTNVQHSFSFLTAILITKYVVPKDDSDSLSKAPCLIESSASVDVFTKKKNKERKERNIENIIVEKKAFYQFNFN